ncbi:MAG: hypothetical protein KAY32_15305 [Candidatus Eisenbacteria sp.]|nr:hypothetical protein [Candidatus Eisenbacteria bacterium]
MLGHEALGKVIQHAGKTGTRHTYTLFKFEIKEYVDHRPDHSTAIDPVSTEKAPRWLYVFTVESWGVCLRCEARVDGKNKYSLVDWKKDWYNQDTREPSKVVTELSVRGPATDEFTWSDPGVYAMLSRIQLPYRRLKHYIGNKDVNSHAPMLVARRCTMLTPAASTHVSVQGGKHVLYLRESIMVADRVAAQFAIACRRVRVHQEKHQLEYDLACAALKVLKEVLNEEDDFVKDGKFKEQAAKKVVKEFESKQKDLVRSREAFGRRFKRVTSASRYDEAIKDHDGENKLEGEQICIRARHALNKMQSRATRAQMRRELNDANSWINKYFRNEELFTSGRKFTAFKAEFCDFLGEYGQVWYATVNDKRGWIKKMLPATVNRRLGLSLAPYIASWKTSMFGPGRLYRINVNGAAQAYGNAMPKRLLLMFEALNLLMAYDTFARNRKRRKITDYAGPLGALCDLTGVLGGRAKEAMAAGERQAAAKARLAIYKESRKLVIFSRVIGVIGIVGGICDMIEAYSAATEAAQTRNLGLLLGFLFIWTGAGLGVEVQAIALAGLGTGPVGLIAVGLVLIGVIVVNYFKETKLETWLRTCSWGRDYLEAKMDKQLSELDLLLARFNVTSSYPDLPTDSWGIRLANTLRIEIAPGFVHAKSRFTIAVECSVKKGVLGLTNERIYTGTKRVTLDAQGRPQPVVFDIPLFSPDLIKRKIAGFKEYVRVYARLQLNKKVKVPEKKNALFAFWYVADEHDLVPSNVEFD